MHMKAILRYSVCLLAYLLILIFILRRQPVNLGTKDQDLLLLTMDTTVYPEGAVFAHIYHCAPEINETHTLTKEWTSLSYHAQMWKSNQPFTARGILTIPTDRNEYRSPIYKCHLCEGVS